MHLMELTRYVKNQTKDDIVFWFSQRDEFKGHRTYNPADYLGKFNLLNESPQKWFQFTKHVMSPEWLNVDGILSEYLPNLLKNSKNSLKQHKSGANT